ncbi:MAG: RidA family protein [Alphaproteobacteria bacterium]|nr:RidA family protein [Alphaproteobacteria bacterium]
MSSQVEERLKAAGIVIPAPTAPAANYIPFTRVGDLVFVSGQIPMVDGKIEGIGKVGRDLDTDAAKAIARICAINLLSQAKAATYGNLDKVVQVVKLGGFVNCVDDFTEQPEVINGASDLMVLAFESRGRHSRFAVGTNALPRGVSVEVEGVFQIEV